MVVNISVLLFIFSLVLSVSGDVLISDFENETKQNNLGWDWYYFSDVKDMGNSKILNSGLKADSSYKDFKSEEGGHNSLKCGNIIFEFGDERPISRFFSDEYAPFVGMGTDLIEPGKTVDLRNAKGLSFFARSNDSLMVIVELATKDISDYNYYQITFKVTPEWKHYEFPFFDSLHANTDWERPPFDRKGLDFDSSLISVQKINWIINDFCGHNKNRKGYLMIDDVRLLGIDSLPGRNTTRVRNPADLKISIKNYSTKQAGNYDLFGRMISNEKSRIPFCSGMYIKPHGEKAPAVIMIK